MNDAKPTSGWNESKPMMMNEFEELHAKYVMNPHLYDLTKLIRNHFCKSIEGTEPITVEWLIEKWEFKMLWGRCSKMLQGIELVFADGLFGFCIDNYDNFESIVKPPKTRDEFRMFAERFGLEEKTDA
jgi:hypothetical protein